MAKLKVFELAPEFKMSSSALMQVLRKMGIPVKSHMTTVDEELRVQIKEWFDQERAEIKKEYERKKQAREKELVEKKKQERQMHYQTQNQLVEELISEALELIRDWKSNSENSDVVYGRHKERRELSTLYEAHEAHEKTNKRLNDNISKEKTRDYLSKIRRIYENLEEIVRRIDDVDKYRFLIGKIEKYYNEDLKEIFDYFEEELKDDVASVNKNYFGQYENEIDNKSIRVNMIGYHVTYRILEKSYCFCNAVGMSDILLIDIERYLARYQKVDKELKNAMEKRGKDLCGHCMLTYKAMEKYNNDRSKWQNNQLATSYPQFKFPELDTKLLPIEYSPTEDNIKNLIDYYKSEPIKQITCKETERKDDISTTT